MSKIEVLSTLSSPQNSSSICSSIDLIKSMGEATCKRHFDAKVSTSDVRESQLVIIV